MTRWDGKRSVAEWPKLPRPSSTLPFAKSKDGYTGLITTASFNMQAKLVPVQRESEKSPDFRVLTSTFEFGAAWKKTSQNGRDYLSVRLDDPSFAAPIFANLVEGENANDHILIWSRSQR